MDCRSAIGFAEMMQSRAPIADPAIWPTMPDVDCSGETTAQTTDQFLSDQTIAGPAINMVVLAQQPFDAITKPEKFGMPLTQHRKRTVGRLADDGTLMYANGAVGKLLQ